MIIRRIFWYAQKIHARFVHLFFPKINQISLRREAYNSIQTLVTTNNYIGLDHYKNLPNTNYRRILKISNSILNPKTGILWLNKKLIKESSYWTIDSLKKWEPYPYFPSKLSGSYTFLPDNGFFHFLVEDLPRYLEVHTFNQNLTTIAGSNSNYMTDMLSILNIKNYLIIQTPVKVENIIISEKISGQIFSNTDLKLIRTSFSKYIKRNQNRNVFISRNDKNGYKIQPRGIDKKKEIEKIFSNFGFEIVCLEEYNLSDQIDIMSSALRIAGFHGAGLANMIWSRNANIIEISRTRKTRHFEHLSEICSHAYNFYSIMQPISDLNNIIRKSFNQS